jgi:probable F420-dependent oxidoreductase
MPASRRPFRFFASASALPASRLTEVARQAEACGYEAMLIADHVRDMLAPVAFMAHVAAVTARLRVGVAVQNNDLRHPVLSAMELASIDQLSGGRVIVGIGAGWNQSEYSALGLRYDPPGTRIERLGEAIKVMKQAFEGPVHFEGMHYRVEGLEAFPRSFQRPHPPFLVGGGGKRLLSLAAREAQIVGLSLRQGPLGTSDVRTATAAATDEKVAWVGAAAGDRLPDIDIHVHALLGAAEVTGEGRHRIRRLADHFNSLAGTSLTERDLEDSPHVFLGSADHLVEKLLAMRERWGISAVTLDRVEGVGDFAQFAPVIARLA